MRAAGSVLELLDTSNLELRVLSTAIAANVLAFSDSLLLTNEECIDGFLEVMEVLLDAIKRWVWAVLLLVLLCVFEAGRLLQFCVESGCARSLSRHRLDEPRGSHGRLNQHVRPAFLAGEFHGKSNNISVVCQKARGFELPGTWNEVGAKERSGGRRTVCRVWCLCLLVVSHIVHWLCALLFSCHIEVRWPLCCPSYCCVLPP